MEQRYRYGIVYNVDVFITEMRRTKSVILNHVVLLISEIPGRPYKRTFPHFLCIIIMN